MWKIIFTYGDGATCRVTGKGKGLNSSILQTYYFQFGGTSDGGTLQLYPKKKYRPIKLKEAIDLLVNGVALEKKLLYKEGMDCERI